MTTLPQRRKQVLDFLQSQDIGSLREMDLSKLESTLSTHFNTPFDKKAIESLLYRHFGRVSILDNGKYAGSGLQLTLEYEDESIDRLNKLLETDISTLPLEEVIKSAKEMFFLSKQDYYQLREEKGLAKEEEHQFNYNIDSTILLHYAQALGAKNLLKQLKTEIPQHDFNLGYFATMAKLHITDRTSEERLMSSKRNDLSYDNLHGIVHSCVERERLNIPKYETFHSELTTNHTIPPPQLLSNQTINLPGKPYAIQFTKEGYLAVLCSNAKQEKKQTEENALELFLHLYDVNSAELKKTINTHLSPMFEGFAGIVSSGFLGSMSIGSDNVLYLTVHGKNKWGDLEKVIKRYTSTLKEITDTTDTFTKAFSLLGYDDWHKPNLVQITEDQGKFYFIEGLNSDHREYNIVITDGKDILSECLYSNYTGMSSNEWPDKTNLFVHNGNLYVQAMKQIFLFEPQQEKPIPQLEKQINQLEQSPSQLPSDIESEHESELEPEDLWFGRALVPYKRPHKNFPPPIITSILSEPEIEHCCIPSVNAMSPNGNLYVVTKKEGEVVNSIKGYKINNNIAEFATHVYPENHPGGWPCMRYLAISNQNILAYTDLYGKKVHLYQLQE